MSYQRKVAGVLMVAATLLLADGVLFAKRVRQSELVSLYAVNPELFDADFDGDGSPDRLAVDGTDLIVLSAGHEIARLPRATTDGTFRTQLALRHTLEGPRLLIFDVAGHPPEVMRVIAGGGDGQLGFVQPDRE